MKTEKEIEERIKKLEEEQTRQEYELHNLEVQFIQTIQMPICLREQSNTLSR
ncbi:hypothetical protein [Beggiatoa leptomitoformis]|uniref:Uncharacterized protein n=1 Tax=Beggiatoa leptomitoformis TaxID=288004 RepID=A0A650GCS8_9GAMM|nr:hypothetical protein [Beggiatoa leptomitoformis]QGX03709.1 hypothetical protein AL038_19065 [Beggiatoa leptomitoformis]QGX04094.1 hypothetical protein BLE401_18650 [Beggiatoa leptomitoformis]